MRKLILIAVLGVAVVVVAALVWAMRYPEIEPIAPPDPTLFDRGLVERGEMLAGIGNCANCHTRRGGEDFSGGLALETPFGTVFSTNITPDPETGIGTWSEQAFIRAMHEGVSRDGHYLYPAFPYDFFARVTEQDVRAIYAFLMSQQAVNSPARQNELRFPFNIRLLMAGWNLLFLEAGEYQPRPEMDDEWNRGAYLAEGLGHCGACHSPRNMFGAAPKAAGSAYSGGYAEGWYVPPLDASSPGPIPWTLIELVNYLIDGWDGHHGIAAGPMTPVVNDLYEQSEDDIFAIAAYVLSLKGDPLDPEERDTVIAAARADAELLEWGHPDNPLIPDDPLLQEGARVFENQCATCHKTGGQPVPLALTTVVNAPDPVNLIEITFKGILPPPRGVLERQMPARSIEISDEEMVALAAFVRDWFTDKPRWQGLEDAVRKVRPGGQ